MNRKIDARIVDLITLRENKFTNQPSTWHAHIEYRGGTSLDETAGSLAELLERLPAFSDRHRSDGIRIRVLAGFHFVHEDDFLTLLEVNQGARGLDLSHCSLGSKDLGSERIKKARWEFFEKFKYDPAWWIPGSNNSLDLHGLLAKEADFSHVDLQGADLSFAQMDETVWWHANLSHVSFSHAKLNACSFGGADLRGASLARAELVGSTFFGMEGPARLDGASIFGARLTQANLNWVSLRDVRGFGEHTDLRQTRL